ncbi:unnamed protein product [Rotaria sp. Silwood1]|nr:unnamed protein product [Rotaria sp. Silwood1]CAF1397723.1 unnamed protein product [Rotaria sp. Silwood1]CAF3613356.1 unnamed protein product [Rotaria sp. Silwood1]CAF3621350.1 unnamed protein product [Rotaria sp. Silwood1]CAF4740092.1 unnamed protein product [Rotaria sp. Silwood1]
MNLTTKAWMAGPPLEVLLNICPQPPYIKDMSDNPSNNWIFMIKPFKYNASNPNREPVPINEDNRYIDAWNEHHVRMPCSISYTTKDGHLRWPIICQLLCYLKRKCDNHTATVEDLKRIIENCAERHYNMDCLEHLINEIYSNEQRLYFMSIVLSNLCSLVLNVDLICSRPPPLLRIKSKRAVTMSQRQAASLLACAFFCLFPYRSSPKVKKEYESFQNPNFNTLYQRGPIEKIEKLKCILHYFERITRQMPNGVITFRRYELSDTYVPKWSKSTKGLIPMHLTTAQKIEDIDCVLQIDFANRYIGGGVLTSGCIQEEIRFITCPEMLLSLLVCEALEPNECIYLIGCERYSSYKGYSKTFQYDGDYIDNKPKDNWGRKWSHLVAIDAVYFRDRSAQYNMKYVKRDLIKAFAGFHTQGQTSDHAFPIATGNWGCGVFNGDKQLKAIIQLIAASEAVRPLIYAAYGDKNVIESFYKVYDYLIGQRAKVRDLYRYLDLYCNGHRRCSLFDFILRTPVSTLDS